MNSVHQRTATPLRFAGRLALLAVAMIFALQSQDCLRPGLFASAAPSAARPAHAAPTQAKTVPQKTVAHLSAFESERRMSPGQLMKRWDPAIAAASRRFDVPETWIRAVMQIESGGRTMQDEARPITSSAGALGLMQVMPATYQDMRQQHGLGPDPFNPRDNILAGAAYLRWLRERYPYPALFAAYNDGPGNLEQRMISGGLLPAETRDYVSDIKLSLETGNAIMHWKKARFTRPDGSPVWIDGAAGGTVRASLPNEYAPGVQSVITVGRVKQGVRESVSQVQAIIRLRRGKT